MNKRASLISTLMGNKPWFAMQKTKQISNNLNMKTFLYKQKDLMKSQKLSLVIKIDWMQRDWVGRRLFHWQKSLHTTYDWLIDVIVKKTCIFTQQDWNILVSLSRKKFSCINISQSIDKGFGGNNEDGVDVCNQGSLELLINDCCQMSNTSNL